MFWSKYWSLWKMLLGSFSSALPKFYRRILSTFINGFHQYFLSENTNLEWCISVLPYWYMRKLWVVAIKNDSTFRKEMCSWAIFNRINALYFPELLYLNCLQWFHYINFVPWYLFVASPSYLRLWSHCRYLKSLNRFNLIICKSQANSAFQKEALQPHLN